MKSRSRPLQLSIIAASLSIAFGASENTFAQQTSADDNNSAINLTTIIVTGTRANNRTGADSLSPIDQLSRKDLESTGSSELATALATLLPSLNFPRPSVTDTTDAVRPAQLRGLSPDQTLVLVNGKRRHTTSILNASGTQGRGSAPADLNAIPIAAIERIEVLRDGAAAQYGSDAIAGVINIVLKKGAAGGDLEASYGKHDKSDGVQKVASVSAGTTLSDLGWLRFTAEKRDQGFTNRALPDFRNPAEPLYGQVSQRFGDPDSNQGSIFLNGQLKLNDQAELYVFGNYSDRDTKSAGFYRPALDSRNILSIYPQGYLPIEASNSRDESLVAGVRGTVGSGWRWDISLNYGANRFKLNVDHSLNTSLGTATPTSFYDGTLDNSQTLFNADLAKEYAVDGLAGPLTVAWGVESRHEKYDISAGAPESYFGTGAQVFAGFRPSDAGSHDRNSKAVYVNLEADLTQRLSGSVALRDEHYSDFGNAVAAKLAGRFAIAPEVALRATASTGFRAPSLVQQYYSTTTTSFISSVPYDVRTFAVTNPVARQLGAEDLKAEKSTNYSFGVLLQPSKAFTTTIDVYQIDIKDRIVLSENLTGAAVRSFLAAHGYANTDGGRYFTNAIDTRTRGLDLVGSYRLDLSSRSRLDFTAGYNHNRTDIEHVAANPAILAQNGLSVLRIGRAEIGRITKGSPADKVTFSADYSLDSWSAHGLLTRYGEFTSFNASNPALDQTFSANWVLDLATSYKLQQWKFTAGVDNVTNKYPDQLTPATRPNTVLPYSQSSPYGFNGRFAYVKAGYSW
jgi:iron complex outermembrane receptor protein